MDKIISSAVPQWVIQFSNVLEAVIPNQGDVEGAIIAHPDLAKNPAALSIAKSINSSFKNKRTPIRFLTTQKASELCGFSKSTLDKLRCDGGGPPFVRVGGRCLYPESELESWLLSRGLVTSTAQACTTRPDLVGKPPVKRGEKRTADGASSPAKDLFD